MSIQVFVDIEPTVEAVEKEITAHIEWIFNEDERRELILRRNDGAGAIRARMLTQGTISLFPGTITPAGDFSNRDWICGNRTKITRGALIYKASSEDWDRPIRTLLRRAATHQKRWPN